MAARFLVSGLSGIPLRVVNALAWQAGRLLEEDSSTRWNRRTTARKEIMSSDSCVTPRAWPIALQARRRTGCRTAAIKRNVP